MEVVAIILLIIGALAIGTTTEKDSPLSEEPVHAEFISGVPAEGKDQDLVPSIPCRHAGNSIPNRDLTVPYRESGKGLNTDHESKDGVDHEE